MKTTSKIYGTVKPSIRLVFCLAIFSMISFTTLLASAGKFQLVKKDQNKLINVNSFEWFQKSMIDWVKEDPEGRYLGFVMSSHRKGQKVGYSEGALSYQPATGGSYLSFPEGVSGDGVHLLNTRGWNEAEVCPDADYECTDDELHCFTPNIHPFDPYDSDKVSISIFSNEKVLLAIGSNGATFTADYKNGILYGFGNDGILYSLSFSKEFSPGIPR